MRERIAFTICGTTVSSYPTMPEISGRPRAARHQVLAQLIFHSPRAETRAVKGLWRNSPRVLADSCGNLRRKKPYSDYTAASVLLCQMKASGGKDTLLRNGFRRL